MKRLIVLALVILIGAVIWAEEGAPITISGEATAEGIYNPEDLGYVKLKNSLSTHKISSRKNVETYRKKKNLWFSTSNSHKKKLTRKDCEPILWSHK